MNRRKVSRRWIEPLDFLEVRRTTKRDPSVYDGN
jgi:hypothetical protein